MKFMYLTVANVDFASPDGVAKKIFDQLEGFSQSFDSYLFCRNGSKSILYSVRRKLIIFSWDKNDRFSFFTKAARSIKTLGIDYVYIRYPKADPIFILFLAKIKKETSRIFIEIPTFPYEFEGNGGIYGNIKKIIDKTCRKSLFRYVDKIVTFSDDRTIFKIPCINIVNCFNFNRVVFNGNARDVNDNKIKLIAVSSMFKVNGYERVINGLAQYYSRKSDICVEFYLVGNGECIEQYKNLVNKHNLDKYVKFFGFKTGIELDKCLKDADIGINSLAIHRQNLKKESTLKTREYAAYGLPMVSSSEVDALSQDMNKKMVFRVSADDSPVNIQELINFFYKIKNNNINYKKQIREDAEHICSTENVINKIIIEYIN